MFLFLAFSWAFITTYNDGLQGRIQNYLMGGGGGGDANDYVRVLHITSTKRKVPYGRGPGPT